MTETRRKPTGELVRALGYGTVMAVLIAVAGDPEFAPAGYVLAATAGATATGGGRRCLGRLRGGRAT